VYTTQPYKWGLEKPKQSIIDCSREIKKERQKREIKKNIKYWIFRLSDRD